MLQLRMDEIQKKLGMIQPSDEGYTWTMDWLGYNLTGIQRTKVQSVYWLHGIQC